MSLYAYFYADALWGALKRTRQRVLFVLTREHPLLCFFARNHAPNVKRTRAKLSSLSRG